MDTFFYIPSWDSKNKNGYRHFQKWIKANKIKKGNIIICYPWEMTWPMEHVSNGYNLQPKLYEKINLTVIINCFLRKEKFIYAVGKFGSMQIINWKFYWFHDYLRESKDLVNLNPNPFDIKNFEFKKIFTCFNNEPRPHRIYLMDQLWRNNLLPKYGDVSWHTPIKNKKQFKYWKKPSILRLKRQNNHGFAPHDINAYRGLLPAEWYESPVHIVTESSVTTNFLTEKTAQPILMQKLFLVVGCKNYHKHLEDLGFKLFDNIFDYSFDAHENMQHRINGIVENICRLQLQMDNLHNLYKDTKPILQYNFEIYIQLLKSSPEIVKSQNIAEYFGLWKNNELIDGMEFYGKQI